MAQQFPTSAQVIYDVLAADTVLAGLLGTYHFKGNASPVTAMSIVSAGEDLPSLRRVKGVECVIQDAGNTRLRSYIDQPADTRTEWSVFIVSWEPSKGSDLQVVVNRILGRFVGSSAVQTVATTDGLGSLVQTKIHIWSDMPIVPAVE